MVVRLSMGMARTLAYGLPQCPRTGIQRGVPGRGNGQRNAAKASKPSQCRELNADASAPAQQAASPKRAQSPRKSPGRQVAGGQTMPERGSRGEPRAIRQRRVPSAKLPAYRLLERESQKAAHNGTRATSVAEPGFKRRDGEERKTRSAACRGRDRSAPHKHLVVGGREHL